MVKSRMKISYTRGRMIDTHRTSVETSEGKRLLVSLRRRWEDNIKVEVMEIRGRRIGSSV
jgi:hypothetical protein